jgi:hypothetical protein
LYTPINRRHVFINDITYAPIQKNDQLVGQPFKIIFKEDTHKKMTRRPSENFHKKILRQLSIVYLEALILICTIIAQQYVYAHNCLSTRMKLYFPVKERHSFLLSKTAGHYHDN